jgi:hypothetical protein|tara:strand:+ start:1051 stop:1257 length:207 start_codon:yes stop_codon:yes gene_type:complete
MREFYRLTKSEYEEWNNFCTDNYKEIYENKDGHMVHYMPTSDSFHVYIDANEQSGMQNFLEKLLAYEN